MPIKNEGRPFQVHVEWRDDVVTLEFLGELDLWGSDEAAKRLAQAVSAAPSLIVVNLHGLSFVGSTGLRCLLEAKLLADSARARMVIVNGSGAAHRLLELTRTDQLIEMVDDSAQLDQRVTRA